MHTHCVYSPFWLILRYVIAFPTDARNVASNMQFLELPITTLENPFRNQLGKRSALEIGLLYEQDLFYAATLEIGTPAQNISVLFDTGSSDMWVMSSSNPYCLPENGVASYSNETYNGQKIDPSIDCQLTGTYNANASSSSQKLDIGRFYTNYSDGSFADGYWCKEKIMINGNDISNLQFGVAEVASIPSGGVLGIGFQSLESVRGYSDAPDSFYPNFPQVLKNEYFINTVSYSLFLNSNQSSILFGAIDTSKFTGNMYTFPMVNEYPNIVDKPATLATTLQGIGAQSVKNCKQKTFFTSKAAALLDSGTSLMNAPLDILEDMASFVNASYSEEDGIYILQCPSNDDDTTFVFDFGDLKINVPLSELLLLPPEDGYCGFGVMPAEDSSFTLGQVFLSSAYVVYDLDHYQISLAQANDDTEASVEKIQQISQNGDVPGAASASAIPWSTSEPLSVTSDIFEGSALSCISSQLSNITTFPGDIQTLSTSSGNTPSLTGNLSYSISNASYVRSSEPIQTAHMVSSLSHPSASLESIHSSSTSKGGYKIAATSYSHASPTVENSLTTLSNTVNSASQSSNMLPLRNPSVNSVTFKSGLDSMTSHTESSLATHRETVSNLGSTFTDEARTSPESLPYISVVVTTVTQIIHSTTTVSFNMCTS